MPPKSRYVTGSSSLGSVAGDWAVQRQPGGFLRPIKGYNQRCILQQLTTACFKHVSALACQKATDRWSLAYICHILGQLNHSTSRCVQPSWLSLAMAAPPSTQPRLLPSTRSQATDRGISTTHSEAGNGVWIRGTDSTLNCWAGHKRFWHNPGCCTTWT